MDAPLDRSALAAAPAKSKPYKITIGKGLSLLISPNGSKLWRLRYRFAGVAKGISLGAFPDTSIAQAIKSRDEARSLLKAGADPSAIRKAEQSQRPGIRSRAKAFRLVMTLQNALTIETPRQILSLTPEQTGAVRAFLLAVESGGNSNAAN